MSVNYAILGLLSNKPMSGYDLKKVMQDSSFMYWSGNNNQIYKALLQLCCDDYLTSETHHQEGAPSKKIYSITDNGRQALKEWVCSTDPEMPEFKKPFLVQLACAGQLKAKETEALIIKYQQELNTQLIMQKEKQRRRKTATAPSQLEGLVEEMINVNIITFYQSELEWTQKLLEEMMNKCREE